MIPAKKALAGLCGAALIACSGCDIFNPSSGDGSPEVSRSIVSVNVAADYTEGNTAVFDIEKGKAYGDLLSIDSDNSVRTCDGAVFIIQRTQCNITKITGSAISEDSVDRDEHIGNATNIHDIAFISTTKAYVTQYGATDVVIYNPSTGRKKGGTISLASYAPEGAATPNMDAAVYYGGTVYVGLQKLGDDFSTTDNSSIVAIDAETDKVTKEIVLKRTNPQGMALHGGKLYVACTGAYGAKDGGIEVIDLSSNTADGVLINENKLGGDVSNVLIFNDTKGYAVVAGADWTNSVVCFNPANGKVRTTLPDVANAAQFGLATDGTYLYVGDRSATDPGLLVFDPSDNSLVSGPHDLGMPPNAIALLEVEE